MMQPNARRRPDHRIELIRKPGTQENCNGGRVVYLSFRPKWRNLLLLSGRGLIRNIQRCLPFDSLRSLRAGFQYVGCAAVKWMQRHVAARHDKAQALAACASQLIPAFLIRIFVRLVTSDHPNHGRDAQENRPSRNQGNDRERGKFRRIITRHFCAEKIAAQFVKTGQLRDRPAGSGLRLRCRLIIVIG